MKTRDCGVMNEMFLTDVLTHASTAGQDAAGIVRLLLDKGGLKMVRKQSTRSKKPRRKPSKKSC